MKRYVADSYARAAVALQAEGFSVTEVSRAIIGHLKRTRRTGVIQDVISRITTLAENGGAYPIIIRTSEDVLSAAKKSIQKKVDLLFGSKSSYVWEQDPTLIGGIILKKEDTVIDYAYASLLADLKDTLSH